MRSAGRDQSPPWPHGAASPTASSAGCPAASTTTSPGRTPTAETTRPVTSSRMAFTASSASAPPRLDDHRERLPPPPVARGEADGDDVARPHAVGRARGALDVGRVDVAAAHDDHVLAPAADHDRAVRPGSPRRRCRTSPPRPEWRPGRPRSGSPGVTDSPRSCSAPTSRSPSTRARPRRRPGPRCPAAAGPSCGKPRDRAVRRRRRGPAAALQLVGVDHVDLQSGVDRRERDPERGLGHAVGAQHRLGAQPEPRAGVGERGDRDRVDRLGAVQRDPQRRQVERAVVDPGELAAEHA